MFSVAVVGLGRIGGQYPAGVDGVPRNHLGAVLASEGLRVVAAIDPDPEACAACANTWPELEQTQFCADLAALPTGIADIITICTPPGQRLALASAALDKQPKVLVIDKPLALTVAEGEEIVRRAKDCGVTLRVNFHRALDPGHRRAHARVEKIPVMVIARYSGGIYNYASHMVDSLLDWFGPVARVQALGEPSNEIDPRLSFRCVMEAGFDSMLIGIGGVTYDQFECDLLFADHRIELANGGVETRYYDAVPDLHYQGYRQLRMSDENIGLVDGLTQLYAGISGHLADGAPLGGCDGARALAGLAIIEAALRSAQRGGAAEIPRAVTA